MFALVLYMYVEHVRLLLKASRVDLLHANHGDWDTGSGDTLVIYTLYLV